ncbi:MAG: DinB family protein [Candidatus Hodarchaeota archaeon]
MNNNHFEFIKQIAKYSSWINEKLIKNLEKLTTKKFNQDIGSRFVNDTECPTSSLRSIVEHCMIGLEFGSHIVRCLVWDENATIQNYHLLTKEQLLGRWGRQYIEFKQLLSDHIGKTVIFNDEEIYLGSDFFFAFFNHLIYHTGQFMIALKIVGEEAIDLDYMTFLKEIDSKRFVTNLSTQS